MTDRTVHAWGKSGLEVVRYDKAGKWYLEPRQQGGPRQHVRLDEAAATAMWLWYEDGGSVNIGARGGGAFDARIRQFLAERNGA